LKKYLAGKNCPKFHNNFFAMILILLSPAFYLFFL
jgi:hypothetical protein